MCSYVSKHHFKKKKALFYILLCTHTIMSHDSAKERIGWRRILSSINSYKKTKKYIISSKTLCCVAKKWNSSVLITTQQMPHKSTWQGSFCTVLVCTSNQADGTAAGWLLMVATALCSKLTKHCLTAVSLYLILSEDPKAFQNLSECSLMNKGDIEA